MADDHISPVNVRAHTEGNAVDVFLDLMRQTEGDHMAVAIANAHIFAALNFIYRVTGASSANAAIEMFRAELAKAHPIIDAEAASGVLQ